MRWKAVSSDGQNRRVDVNCQVAMVAMENRDDDNVPLVNPACVAVEPGCFRGSIVRGEVDTIVFGTQ
jgi:hypothetical protein